MIYLRQYDDTPCGWRTGKSLEDPSFSLEIYLSEDTICARGTVEKGAHQEWLSRNPDCEEVGMREAVPATPHRSFTVPPETNGRRCFYSSLWLYLLWRWRRGFSFSLLPSLMPFPTLALIPTWMYAGHFLETTIPREKQRSYNLGTQQSLDPAQPQFG